MGWRKSLIGHRRGGPAEDDGTVREHQPNKPFSVGIKRLYDPEDSNIDIVFVHGLTGDRDATWTARDATEPWPKVLLPPMLPKARILTFGYDADVGSWERVVSQNRIKDHSWNLLVSLSRCRDNEETNERPIIFVCHSLGGLVCEDALTISKQRSERHLRNIFDSTRGVMFLGTPHHGAGLAQLAEVLSRYIGLIKKMNSDPLSVLRRDSEVLAKIQDEFHTMVKARKEERRQPIEITCFYEELPLGRLGLVVPKDSALLPGEIPIGIHSDHINMTKFARADDPGFEAVCGELKRWITNAAKESLYTLEDTIKHNCLSDLCLTDPLAVFSPEKQGNSHDNEIQSLVSDSDDISSQASVETTNEERTGKALIRVFLVEEPDFRPLCERAMDKMGAQRFIETLRQLLKSFYKNLTTESEAEAEKSVAGLLRTRRGRLRVCQQLVIHIEQERNEACQDHRVDLEIAPNAKQHVETWLMQTFGRQLDQDMDNESSDSEDGSEEDEFLYITGMENFLRESRSFQILLRDFMLMFLPTELKHVLLSIPKAYIWVSQKQDVSLPNSLKAWVEDKTQVRWNWWPLEPRKRMLQEDESRMFWRCTCGAQQWKEISLEQNDIIKKILDLSNDNPTLPHWCKAKGFRALLNLWPNNKFSKASSSQPGTMISSAAQRYTPSGNDVSSHPSGNLPIGNGQSSVTIQPTRPDQRSPTIGQRPQASVVNLSEPIQGWILLGIQGARRALKPAQILVKDRSTDHSVFQELKECYRTHRGLLRLWFSIWRLEFCQVVKFNRLTRECMVREYKDLPTHRDYQYAPRSGTPDARNPPISPHLFEALFYTCRSPCTWPLPHDCISLPPGTVHLERIPKRTRCFERDKSSPIWGLEAVFAVSFAYVFIYHLVMITGPFIFFAWWLKDHPDDLQNASIPLAIVLGALSLFWSGGGILTGKIQD